MNIHEYQAKAVLRQFGVPVPRGVPVLKVEDAEAAAVELGGPVWVVKSQIHAGGRGKGTFKEADAGEQGRRAGREERRGGEGSRDADARPHAGDAADRRRGPPGQPRLRRGRLGHRERVLPLDPGRPRDEPRLLRRLDGGRHGHRGGGPPSPRAHHLVLGRSGDRRAAAPRPHRRQGARARGRPGQTGRQDRHPALCRLRRQGHGDAGGQPADPLGRGRAALPRRQDLVRQQRDLPAPRRRRAARRERGGRQGDRGLEVRPLLRHARRARSAAW